MNLDATKIKQQVELIRNDASIFLTDKAYLAKRLNDIYVNGEARKVYASLVQFSCRVITRSGSEKENVAAQARQIEQDLFTGLYRMQIPFTLDVKESDHIFHDDKVTGKRIEFEVVYGAHKHEFTGAVVIQLQEIK